jgi:pimeloyl-ACP methyl ester carboxylesterase
MADDLKAVMATAGRPVVLVGHSIGGMINLTFCRRYPAELGRSVAGIVEMNSTYTDPTRTTKNASLATALQKPVAEPLLHLTIALSPLVRAMNALRYMNGMSHLQNAQQSFAGAETREQLDFVSRYDVKSSPAVVARGGLAMFHWDGSDALRHVTIPVLLIAGDRDTTTLPAASEYMKEKLRRSDLMLAGPAKHMGVVEQNRVYDESVRAFANACFGRTTQSASIAGR